MMNEDTIQDKYWRLNWLLSETIQDNEILKEENKRLEGEQEAD